MNSSFRSLLNKHSESDFEMVTNNDLERFKKIGRVRIYNDNLGHKYQRKYTNGISHMWKVFNNMWTKVCVGTIQYVKKKIVSIRLEIRYEIGLNASNGHKLQLKR